MTKILIADDERGVRESFTKLLARDDRSIVTASRGDQALSIASSGDVDLVVMDIRMPGMDGLDVFRRLREVAPRLPVIIMTGFGTADIAIEATKLGAFDYHLKPFEPDAMLRSIEAALESVRLMQGQVQIDPDETPVDGDAIIGTGNRMRDVYKAIGRVAQTDATVLLRGETGTGKELVARALYQHSLRKARPLIVVNCVAIPENLLESELFGHERGSFTGASARRIGKFEQAEGGTIFLDEIGDMPTSIQAKILRVLQEKTFERVGGSAPLKANVRIIAATNRDLEAAISEGRFREDLYHRLNVFTIELPPLRDRREDIPALARFYVRRFAGELGIDEPVLSKSALETLSSQRWPGNVRQLQHCLHRALILTHGYPIQADDVTRALERRTEATGRADTGFSGETLQSLVRSYLASASGGSIHVDLLDMVDRMLITEALRVTGGNQTHAAKLLGLTRPTIQAKMQKHGVRRHVEFQRDQ